MNARPKVTSLAAAILAAGSLQAQQIALEEFEFFDGGVFMDGDIEIVNGRIVMKNTPGEAVEVKPDPAGPHALALTDGSQIHGRLVSFGRSEVVWERADASAPLSFGPDEVKRLDLSRLKTDAAGKGGATIKVDGPDWLVGNLTEMRDGKFFLQITPETQIEIARERVEWIALSPAAPSPDAYDGPVGPLGLTGWDGATGPGGAWDYADGALVAKAASQISRTFSVLPERFEMEFTAGDGGSANRGFTLWLRPGTNAARGYTKGALYLRFQASNVNANYYTGDEIKNFTAPLPAEKEEKKLTRYRLLMDRRAGRLVAFVNGKQAADWKLPEAKELPLSASLSWQPSYMSSNMAWTLSNVRLRPWDGADAPEAVEEGKDSLSAPQGRRSGALDTVTAEAIVFDGAELLRKDALYLRLARKDAPEPPPSAVARVWLGSRGEFDVSGIGLKEGKLRMRTAFAGDISLPIEAVSAIEFPHKSAPGERLAAAGHDRLVFRNGDELRGSFMAGGNERALAWKPVKGAGMIEFTQANIAGVLLAPRVKDAAPPPGSAAVRFQNGDWLSGEFTGLDAEGVHLKTAAAELKVARAAVRTVYFGREAPAPVWDGASERSEWTSGIAAPGYYGRSSTQKKGEPDPWRYLDGAFTLPAGSVRTTSSGPVIGRTLAGLPQKVDVSFSISAPDGGASYSIQLFFDDNKPGFMMQGGWDSAYVYDMSPRQQGGVFFNQPQQMDFGSKVGADGKSRHFRFLADREQGRLWVFVNGHFVGEIGRRNASKGSSPKPGTGIAIMPRPARSSVAVSNLWIAPWTGVLPPGTTLARPDAAPEDMPKEAAPEKREEPKPEEPAPQPAQDAIALSNGDETGGVITGADRSVVKLLCDAGEIEVPLSRMTLLEFATKPASAPKGIRLRFASRGVLTVQSFSIENGMVTCRSDAVGELALPLSDLSEIVWPGSNVAAEKTAPKSGTPAKAQGPDSPRLDP